MYIQQLNQQIKQYIVSFWKKVRDLFNVYNEKQLLSFFKWLDQFVKYLIKENSFDPKRIPRLKKGDIIWVAFGHNVGSELGGPRPAIVLEFENHKKDKNIIPKIQKSSFVNLIFACLEMKIFGTQRI